MNYKELNILAIEEKKDVDSDKFWQCFLETVEKCRVCSDAIKGIRKCNPNKLEEAKWKVTMFEHVETLKCFMGCLK